MRRPKQVQGHGQGRGEMTAYLATPRTFPGKSARDPATVRMRILKEWLPRPTGTTAKRLALATENTCQLILPDIREDMSRSPKRPPPSTTAVEVVSKCRAP